MAKIIPRVLGGLGNQLFIYAAARRLACINNADLVIDDTSGFMRDYEYKRKYQLNNFNIPFRSATPSERLEPFSRIRRYLKRRWNGALAFEQRSYICQEGIDFDQRLLTLRPKGTVYLEGYWQSESYFKDIELQIREDLRFKSPMDDQNLQVAQYIRHAQAIAVHVRFFDNPANKVGQGALPNNVKFNYYQQAINEMEQRIPGSHYFVFSEHPHEARMFLPLADDRMTLVHHNQSSNMAYADLWLMTQCQHFIIANSTFSWWGAWLAQYPEKVVITPGLEKREGKTLWGFNGLLPDNWIKI